MFDLVANVSRLILLTNHWQFPSSSRKDPCSPGFFLISIIRRLSDMTLLVPLRTDARADICICSVSLHACDHACLLDNVRWDVEFGRTGGLMYVFIFAVLSAGYGRSKACRPVTFRRLFLLCECKNSVHSVADVVLTAQGRCVPGQPFIPRLRLHVHHPRLENAYPCLENAYPCTSQSQYRFDLSLSQ